MRLSLAAKRALAGVAVAQMLFFLLNLYQLHLFGQYDKKAFVLSGVLLGICVLFFGPTVEELREHRSRR